MKILFISGYPAWNKVSKKQMPSQHLFGMNELIAEYREYENGQVYGILDSRICGGGIVDFYMWEGGKAKILKQIMDLTKKSKEYDLFFDSLNRCSIFLGTLKKLGIFGSRLLTVMHHPPYNIQLEIADSDKYVFFAESYLQYALQVCPRKKEQFCVNEWLPEIEWYDKISEESNNREGFFIDNGKSRRDKEIMITASNEVKVPVVYAADDITVGKSEYAKPYKINLKDDFAIVRKMKHYEAIIVPVLDNKEKVPVGPLGATSFLDSLALGMPILASDNVYFAKDIEEYGLGEIYITGDKESLESAMQSMYENQDKLVEYRENLMRYRNGRSINDYARKIGQLIEEIMEKKG